jgi:hypothetical protein
MKIDVQFDNNIERYFAIIISILIFGGVFVAGAVIVPSSVHAEWDADGSYGDSYYLRSISETLERNSNIFYDISSTLDELNCKLAF